MSLLDLTNYCEDKGYELIPIKKGKLLTCVLMYQDKVIKKGTKTYKTYQEALKDIYGQIYNKLSN